MSKYRRYRHKDISTRTNDFLRKALNTYFVRTQSPAAAVPAGFVYEKQTFHEVSLAKNFNIESWGLDSAEDLRGIKVAKAKIVHDEDDKYRILERLQVNPSRVVSINRTSLVPSAKIPVRIYVDERLQRGDNYWKTVFVGGEVGGNVFPKLIDNQTTFYDINFGIKKHASEHKWRYLNDESYDVADIATIRNSHALKFNIYCNIPNNDPYIDNYQQWESTVKSPLLLPNLLFEIQVRRMRQLMRIYSGTYGNYGWSHVPWTIVNRQHMQEMLDDSPNWISMLDYYYPQDNAQQTILPHTEEDTVIIFESDDSHLLMNQYYGDNWIYNWKPPEELKQAIINAQKNIILPDFWTRYALDGGKMEAHYNLTKQRSQTANLGNVTIEFDRHVGDAHREDIFAAYGFPEKRIMASNFTPGSWNDRWFFRGSIEDNHFTEKFLESLKDLEEGNFSNFKMDKTSFEVAKTNWEPITNTDTRAVTAIKEDTIDNIKLESFDYFEFLTYLQNKPKAAENDDYLMLGNIRSQKQLGTEEDNLLYRYANNAELGQIITDSLKSLKDYFVWLDPKNINEYVNPDDGSGTGQYSHYILKTILEPRPKYKEVLAYKIEKTGGPATGESRTKNKIQNFWIWNSGYNPNEESDIDDSTRPVKIVDTQVKYGEEYTYTAYAYVACIAHKYKYTDFRLTQTTNAYDIQGADGAEGPDGELDLYCVRFYDPLTMDVRPQVFSIASAPQRNPSSGQYSNLAEYNTFATAEYDILQTPQVADFYMNVEPCVKIFKIPMFQKTVSLYDNPGNKISAVPFHIINNENKIGFNIIQDNFTPTPYPAVISAHDRDKKEKYLNSVGLSAVDKIHKYSESPPRYLEVYRIDKKPTSYSSFDGHMVSKIDLRIPNELYNRTDYVLADKIIPNKKYYYVFRYVTQNHMPGHLSVITEAELVDDGGYKYATFDTVDTSEFIQDKFTTKSKSFRKIMQLEPNINQLLFDTREADFTDKAKDQIHNVKLDSLDQNIWDKKFKIRLTSKKTGKITDLNVVFNIRERDFS